MIKAKMKTTIVMPAFNAEFTLEKTLLDVPFDYIDEVVLVDDGSFDKTFEIAIKTFRNNFINKNDKYNISFTILKNPRNEGYGANQKKCYDIALNHGAKIIIMIHPDYQYDPKLIKYLVGFIKEGYFDVVLGSRIRTRKESRDGGMPLYKYIANRFLSFFQNIITGQNLSEWHTGMRAYRREVLENIDYSNFSDDFVFDTQILFAIVQRGYKLADIPVPVRYSKESSSISFLKSIRYGLATVLEMFKFLLIKLSSSQKSL